MLQDFSHAEAAQLGSILDRATQALDAFIASDITSAMNQFNSNLPGVKV